MKASEFITEGKKDRRDVKRTIKPRNPVAHAAQTVAKGSGTHKDKKRAEKQGDTKHKKQAVPMEEIDEGYGRYYCSTDKKWKTRKGPKQTRESVSEVSPPGFKGTVKAMKKHKDIDNPWALAWSMKNKGYKSHKKADGSDK